MRRKSWMNSWSVLRLAALRAWSICSRRLRRFILYWNRVEYKLGVRPSKTETTENVLLRDGYALPLCC